MKISKFKLALLMLIVFISSLAFINPVFALTYQNVHVLVAYDEELANTAYWKYGYSAKTFCEIIVMSVSWRFEALFSIKFQPIRHVSWDSDEGIDNIFDLFDECVEETGFYSGMTYNTIPIDILIAFSDQETGEAYGVADDVTGAVLVFETYYWLSLGQCTDNVLQHELSHPYDCEDVKIEDLDCIMNAYPVYLNSIERRVPYALTTTNWCSDCTNIINENREMWGREQIVGGGPSYPVLPYSKEEVEVETEI